MVPKGVEMVASNGWDRFVMLLSADCFSDTWNVIGLDLGAQTKRLIQSAARQSVKEFMGQATAYWNISFEDERIEGTRVSFMHRLGASKLKPSEIALVTAAADKILAELDDDDTDKTLFLFYALTVDLLQNQKLIELLPDLSSADMQ